MHHSTNNTHLLLYPCPGYGHVIPSLELAHHLLCRGLTITVIISAADLPLIDPLLSSYPCSLHKLLFSYPKLHPSPQPLIAKILSTQQLFNPIVKWFKSHPSPPVAIVSDFFLGWTTDLASHLGIKRVMFSTSGALGSSIFHALWRDLPDINKQNSDKDENFYISFPEIPNAPKFPWWHLPPASRCFKNGDQDFEAFRTTILANMRSWGIVYNTFEGLEGVYVDHIKKQMGHDRVWAIGPLLPDEHGPMNSARTGSSAVPPHDLLMWLDNKHIDSVVYICFGSRATLSEKQMCALLGALKLSNINFIFSVKASDSSSMILSGFEDDMVARRGFVVKGWAPQLAILKHRAVGSYLTHCGWNSILEGIAAGVMMLAWPMGADQFANATLLVDQLGAGKRVCEGGPELAPEANELARLLDESLNGDLRERIKVKELSEGAMKAVKEGTSIRDLDLFVKLVSEL
ncbi:putative UDP-glucuronosyl/UDP-glucosyltransferase [Helianthus annuus]|nr:putative UDP-glucuronosyl/UDP-glucosyltransferase [Helianthus annuus]